ncbi:acyl-CoA dehydrogenase [Xylanibacillus composti]|uniref:Butyryl-CoA dehydrogenase n=1 Tax=Xylanibacillus composti TaxID=1572762 RepID=A0A8J4H5E6_9BACL|nr:acyl-CoA dehydrogenase family protein [Xylanibacillus composti]MDT9725893.1 acyl-CoA dehydrogenase [Xylanibacillus composti]GIQ71278.1 butyryl-CoA dehydrogenase [Xylanibacillus composti]
MSALPGIREKLEVLDVQELKEAFFSRANEVDAAFRFPHENFDDIVSRNLHALPLSEEFGGRNYGFERIFDTLVEMAAGCPSTALCMAMHYYTLAGLSRMPETPMLRQLFQDVHENGEFISSFNQPNVMSQFNKASGFELVKVKIDKVEGGYRINGRKHFVSGCERFKYLPVYGYQENTKSKLGMTALMVTRDDPGVEIKNAWNLSAMKASMSHHVEMSDVFVPDDRLIGREGYGVEDTNELSYWSRLAISAVYQGIAKSAVEHTISIMKRKRDLYSQTNLATMPGPQFTLAEMKIQLEVASNQLRGFARQADEERARGEFTDDLFQKSLITKYYVTNTANEIVRLAMQVEGMASLNQGGLLERLHRDVRAATFHQPTDDLLKEILAKRTLGVVTLRNRWN